MFRVQRRQLMMVLLYPYIRLFWICIIRYYTSTLVINLTRELVDETTSNSPTGKPTKQPTTMWTNSPFAYTSGEAAAAETPSSGAIIGASTLVFAGGFLYLSWCF